MTSLMVLAICSLPPLAIFVVAVAGLRTGQASVALPLVVSAGVLLMPLLSLAFRADEPVLSLRFNPDAKMEMVAASKQLHVPR